MESTLNVWMQGVPDNLAKALGAAEKLTMSKLTLHRTGAGFLLHSDVVWRQLDSRWLQRRASLVLAWKRLAQQDKAVFADKGNSPFQGLKASGFQDAFLALMEVVGDKSSPTPTVFERKAVLTLIGKGFWHISHLDGLCPEQVACWSEEPKVRCLLQKAVQISNDSEVVKRRRCSLQQKVPMPCQQMAWPIL